MGAQIVRDISKGFSNVDRDVKVAILISAVAAFNKFIKVGYGK